MSNLEEINKALKKLEKIEGTKKIRLIGSKLNVQEIEAIAEAVVTCSRLRSVEFAMCEITPEGLELLFSNLHKSSLVLCQLVHVGLGDQQIVQLAEAIVRSAEVKREKERATGTGELYTGCNIKKLDLTFNGFTDEGVIALALAFENDQVYIESLLLGRNKVGDNGCLYLSEAILRTVAKQRLKWLDLRVNQITDVGLGYLSRALQGSALVMLQVDCNAITSAGIVDLCSFLPGTEIQILTLGSCSVDDDTVDKISKFILASKVNQLSLEQNRITDRGGVNLAVMLAQNSKLKLLNLRGNRALTDITGNAMLQAVTCHLSVSEVNLNETEVDDYILTALTEKIRALHTNEAKKLVALAAVRTIPRIGYYSLFKLLSLELVREVKSMIHVYVSPFSLVPELVQEVVELVEGAEEEEEE